VSAMAALLGHRDILFLGLVLLVLPLVASLLVTRTRLRLSCEREVQPNQVAIGETVEARLTLDREGRLPAGVLRFEDHVPPELGRRPRFTVQNVSAAWHREVRYELTGRARGRHVTGPLMVRTSDPFGIAQLDRSFQATSEVLVTPRIWPLPSMSNVGGGGPSGESRPRRVGVSGQEDILVREYRDGDDVRRVHWRSTARRGELMVRREEQAWDPSLSVVLDTRSSAHAGRGENSSFEWAVSAAASIGLHFLKEGFAVNMYGSSGPLSGSAADSESRVAAGTNLLYALTDITSDDSEDFRTVINSAGQNTDGQVLVVVAGRLSSRDAEQLLQCQRNRSQALALVLDVDTWVTRGERASAEERDDHEMAIRILRDKLWRVAEVSNGTTVIRAWEELSHMGGVHA
ncbi:MAG: DUF58 domain-containing protein, partial [Propionibacterium sp.]|nr:DUF58 domain-containing protein [Propionibacterium sp.]